MKSSLRQNPVTRLQAALLRVRIKVIGLGGHASLSALQHQQHAVAFSQCVDCEKIEGRLSAIEEKLDVLVKGLLESDSPPPWMRESEIHLLEAIGEISNAYAKISADRDQIGDSMRELAEGADRFLAGLRQKLTKEQADLFFELIASQEDDGGRRVRSYAEIGVKLGISKQAVQQRFRRMAEKNPSVGDYIKAIRHPEKSRLFSEMSPRERRANGVDGSYDHKRAE